MYVHKESYDYLNSVNSDGIKFLLDSNDSFV